MLYYLCNALRSLFQVPRRRVARLQLHGTCRPPGHRGRIPHDPQHHSNSVHGQHADRPADAGEDETQTPATAVSLHEDRRSVDTGHGVRFAGQTAELQRRLDYVQRGPLAARHSGRAGRHLQLSGAQHLHENAETQSETAQQRESRQSGQDQTVQGLVEVGQFTNANVGTDT